MPLPESHWCLFLDVDGTLLELADHAGGGGRRAGAAGAAGAAARAPRGGAVALVSGRTIDDLDRLFGTLGLPGRGTARLRAPRRARRAARRARGHRAARRCARGPATPGRRAIPGLLLEDKGAGLALHFLKAPQLEHELRAEVALLAAPLVPRFTVLDGHAVIEVKPAAHTKDSAVTRLHAGRAIQRAALPIFIGDDLTDYGGFAAVRRYDGLAIAVGPRVKSEWWLPGPGGGASLARAARGAQLAEPRELRRDRQLPGGRADRRAGAHGVGLPAASGRRPGVLRAAQKEGGDSDKGVFAIDMVDLTRTEQSYLRNSAILETRLYDAHGGVMRILDFAPRFRSARPRVPADDVRAQRGAARRPADAAPAAAAHRGLRRALRAGHQRQPSHPLRRRRPALPRDHRCLAGGAAREPPRGARAAAAFHHRARRDAAGIARRRWRANSSARR